MINRHLVMILIALFIMTQPLSAAEADSPSLLNLDNAGLAIQGYDPVSYHLEGPQKGKKENAFVHEGATYLFSNEENLQSFKASPEKYLPAFGGWCAWAMIDGETVAVDPKTFKIVNNATYLYYNSFFINTLKKWNSRAEKETEASLVQKAEAEWKNLQSP